RKKICCRPRDGEEHQVDADTGGEQHRCPSEHPIFGPRMIRSEPGIAHSAEGDDNDEKYDDPRGEDVVPAKIRSNPVHGAENHCFCLPRSYPSPQDESNDQARSYEKYGLIDT